MPRALLPCFDCPMPVFSQHDKRTPERDPTAKSWQLFGSVLVAHVVIALAVGEVAWDDGYITLAFARTFAESGHIALTPVSETVEGATSPVWFLLLTAAYKLGITSFYGFHLASQLFAALSAAGCAVLLYRLIRPSAPALAWWIAFLALMLGPFRTETANGMEMTLLCLVVLGMLNLISDDDDQPLVGVIVLAALVPLIRLEAAGYVIAGALATVVFSRRLRLGVAIIVSSVASIAFISGVRYWVFGTVGLTNTMIAKQISPYSPPFGTPAWILQLSYSILIEPILALLPAVVVAYVLARMSGVRATNSFRQLAALAKSRRLNARISFGLSFTLGYFVFIVVFGSNYFAPPGRMGAAATLVLIAVAAMVVPVANLGAQEKQRSNRRAYFAAVGLFLVPLVGLLAQDTSWFYIARLNTDSKLAFNSTVAYRKNGEAMEHVRELLQRPKIRALFADVGAPGLCCGRLDILDLGLLANTELAKTGWSGFPDYLSRERPDLIQTHGVWSQESRIYENPQFRNDYTPVVVYDSIFFLRNDLFDRLKSRCVEASTSSHYFYAGLEPASSVKNAKDARVIDKDFIDSLQLASFCRLP